MKLKSNSKTYIRSESIFSTLVFITILGVFGFDNLPFIGIVFKGIMILLIILTLLLNGVRRVNFPIILLFAFSIYCFVLPEYIQGEWSDMFGFNAQTAISVFIASLYAYSIYIYADNEYHREKIIRWISIAGLFLGILLTLVAGPTNLLSIHVDSMTDLLAGYGLQSNHMGFCFGFAFMASFYRYRRTRERGILLLILFNLVFTFLSGSRRALMFCTLSPAIFILLRGNKKKLLINTFWVALFGVVVFFSIMRIHALYDLIGYRIASLFDVLGGGKGEDTTVTRAFMIEYGFELFLQNPIWGYGLNYFSVSYGEISGHEVYAHNNYIELMVSGGLVLLFLYYSKFVSVIRSLFKNHEHNLQSVLFLSILLTLIFSDMASVTYYNRAYYAIFGLALACANISDQKMKIVRG